MEEYFGPAAAEEQQLQEERAARLAPLAKDVVQVVVKTVRATRMYLPNNPVYRKFHEELKDKLYLFFKEEEILSLHVKKFELDFMDKQVYHNPDKEDNIALMFFKDGVREFSFHAGITPEEIDAFIDILKFDMRDRELDDDLVTLMWEKDFRSVSYTVAEEDAADEAEEEELLLRFEEEPDELRSIDQLREASPGEGAGPVGMGGMAAGLSGGGPTEALTEEDYLAIRGTYSVPDDMMLLEELTDVFHEILLTETDSERFDAIADSLGRALEIFVKKGSLALATILVMKLQELSGRAELSQWSGRLKEVLAKAGSPQLVATVGEYIDQSGSEALESAGSYLMQLDASAMPAMVGLLESLKNRKARKSVADIMAGQCAGKGAPLVHYLGHKQWFVVRNVAMILGKVGDRDSVPALGNALRHGEAKVRKEALGALAAIGGDKAADLVAGGLSDADKQVRVLAARLLTELAPEKAYERILALVLDKHFEDGEFAERKDFYELLGRAGGHKAVPLLSDRFNKKSFFGGQKNEEARACAAYGLAAAGGEDASALLKSEIDSKSKLIRTACLEGLRRMPGRT